MQDMQEMQIHSLGQEDPLEGEVATLSSILALKPLQTEQPGGLPPVELQRVGHSWGHWTKHSGTTAPSCQKSWNIPDISA